MANDPHEDRYVTHAEFADFRQELQGNLRNLREEFTRSFADLREDARRQKQPLTAFAGWGSVLLLLVAAALYPRIETDDKHYADIKTLQENELRDAETRGAFNERFRTLDEKVNSAVVNRSDLANRTRDEVKNLEKELDSVRHELDNGLGRRIHELMAPLERDIAWVQAELRKMSSSEEMAQ